MNTMLSILYHEQRDAGLWSTPSYRGILVECRRWYADRPEYPTDDITLDAFVWVGKEQVETCQVRLPVGRDATAQRYAMNLFDVLLAKYVETDELWLPLLTVPPLPQLSQAASLPPLSF